MSNQTPEPIPNQPMPNQPMPMPNQPMPNAQPASPEQRKRNLAQAVQAEVAAGWRVESQTDESAVLVKGSQTNHVLHLILTLLTCFVWGIVWAIMALINRRQTLVIRVDDFGNVLRQRA